MGFAFQYRKVNKQRWEICSVSDFLQCWFHHAPAADLLTCLQVLQVRESITSWIKCLLSLPQAFTSVTRSKGFSEWGPSSPTNRSLRALVLSQVFFQTLWYIPLWSHFCFAHILFKTTTTKYKLSPHWTSSNPKAIFSVVLASTCLTPAALGLCPGTHTLLRE